MMYKNEADSRQYKNEVDFDYETETFKYGRKCPYCNPAYEDKWR